MNKRIDEYDIAAETENLAIKNSNHQRNTFYNKKSSGSPSIAPCELRKIESRKHCRHRNSRQVDLIKKRWLDIGKTLKEQKYNVLEIQL